MDARLSRRLVQLPYSALWPNQFAEGRPTFLARGSHSFQLVPAAQALVERQNVVIDKPRYSAFLATELQEQLHSLSVAHLYFAGVTTNVCVESSLHDAFQRNFSCSLVKDCALTFSTALQAASKK